MAHTNLSKDEVEDYTQVSVLSLYEIVTPGGLDTIGANWRCLQNQKNVLDGFQRDAMIPGGSCDRRWADSAIISTNNAKRAVSAKPTTSLVPGAPNVFTIPYQQKSEVTTFRNLMFNATEKSNAVARQQMWAKQAQRVERLARFG